LYAFLRFATLASLILFAALIGAGAVALMVLPVDWPPPVASADNPPATSCQAQSWLLLDRNCLARREASADPQVPMAAQPGAASTVAVERPEPADAAPAPASTQPRNLTELPPPQPPLPRAVATPLPAPPVEHAAAVGAPIPSPTGSPAVSLPVPAQPDASAAPPAQTSQASPSAPPAVAERPAARPAVAATTRPPAPKRTARANRPAKPPANEALNAVRRFGGSQSEIPVNAYSADGTQRTITIRPTSIQDFYYYSTPR